MKKSTSVLLIFLLLLTGCSQNTVPNQTTESKAEITVSKPNDTKSETKEPANAASGDAGASEAEAAKPYVLTFQAATIDGEEITSDIFAESKLTMINVWATYCNPCLNEMPDLGEIATEYDKAEFQMLGIVCDVTAESDAADLTAAKELIEETKAHTYPHLLLNAELYYNLVGASDSVPTTYFFNQQGELIGYLVGSQSKDNWVSIIESLLADEV